MFRFVVAQILASQNFGILSFNQSWNSNLLLSQKRILNHLSHAHSSNALLEVQIKRYPFLLQCKYKQLPGNWIEQQCCRVHSNEIKWAISDSYLLWNLCVFADRKSTENSFFPVFGICSFVWKNSIVDSLLSASSDFLLQICYFFTQTPTHTHTTMFSNSLSQMVSMVSHSSAMQKVFISYLWLICQTWLRSNPCQNTNVYCSFPM